MSEDTNCFYCNGHCTVIQHGPGLGDTSEQPCPACAERDELQGKIDKLIVRNRNLAAEIRKMGGTASALLWAAHHASECSEGMNCPLFIGELEIYRKVAGHSVPVPKVDAESHADTRAKARKKSR